MPDWKKYVQEHLPPLQLGAEREMEIIEELAQHLEAVYEEALVKGASEEEAHQQAVKQINDWRLLECEVSRVQRPTGPQWLSQPAEDQVSKKRGRIGMGFLQDLRYGLRMLMKHRGFTAVAVLSLALGIGANTAIFSLTDAVLLKTLPVERPEQLYFLDNVGALGGGGSPPYPCFEQFRNHSQSFTGISAFSTFDSRIDIDGQIEQVKGQYVSGNYFSLLGVKALLGRTFSPADDSVRGEGGPDGPVTVISYNYWTRRFGQSPAVIGKVVNVGDKSVTIIGVASPEFFGLKPGVEVNIALPMMLAEAGRFDISNRFFDAIGRLKAGVSVEQARAELDAIYQAFMKDSGINTAGSRRDYFARIELTPASKGLDTLRSQYSKPLRMLMIVVAVVLLIACANVANLLLARASSRRKEFAVRLALGASRTRLVRQMLTESLLLVGIGALVGLVIARWSTSFLVGFFATGNNPISLNLPLDGRVLIFTAGLSLLTVLIFGLAPALQATGDLNPVLKDSASSTTGIRSRFLGGKLLIVLQVALSLVLLIGAGLFLRTLQNLKKLDAGFNHEGVLTMYLDPPATDYQGPRLSGLWQEILRGVQTIPGVRYVSLSQLSPLSGHDRGALIKEVSGYTQSTERDMRTRLNHVSPGYFTTMGIGVLQGRVFTEGDNESGRKVAVLNETSARHYFGVRNPIGARISLMNGSYEIVGVVRDSKHNRLRDEIPRLVYLPTLQPVDRLSRLFLAVRTDGEPADLTSAVRKEVRAAGTNILITKISTLSEQIDQSLLQERLISMLSFVFGFLALLLTCIGLYGVISYDVARRTHEIGIRMALGAQAGDILKLVARQGFKLLLAGMVIGLAGAFALTRVIANLLFDVSATDTVTFTSIPVLLGAVAMLACWIPARRASKVDPMIALRSE